MKIGFIHEHPSWSDALIRAFHEAGIDIHPVNVAELAYGADNGDIPFAVALNRVNIMPSAERSPRVAFHTQHYLGFLEARGVRVINGARAHFSGASKAVQNGIFQRLGLRYPGAVAVYRPEDIAAAASRVGYPLMLKPNIGGSGAGIQRYDDPSALETAVRNRMIDFGIDGTGLVQRFAPSDGFVYRVEMLGDTLFYAIRQPVAEGSYNYCAADGCGAGEAESALDFCVAGGGDRIQPFTPPDDVVRDVGRIVSAAGADLGGVEFFLDPDSGLPCYYDFNPYSNFVSDGERLLGFSPERRFVEFVRNFITA